MQVNARRQSATGILQAAGQPGLAVGLSLEPAYLIVEMPVNRDAVAIEFLRRSQANDGWRLRRTDRSGWQIESTDIPAEWLSRVRRASMSSALRALWAGAILGVALLIFLWVTRQ